MPQTKEEIAKYKKEWAAKKMEDPEYREKRLKKMREIKRKKRLDPKYVENERIKDKEYKDKNREIINQKRREYGKTPQGRKNDILSMWKCRGVKDDDLANIYEDYLLETNCWICGHDFSKYKKCLDHCHETGEVRYICCQKCNSTILASFG